MESWSQAKDFRVLKDLQWLEYCALTGAKGFDDQDLTLVATWPRLRVLMLNYTSVTESGLTRYGLSAALRNSTWDL